MEIIQGIAGIIIIIWVFWFEGKNEVKIKKLKDEKMALVESMLLMSRQLNQKEKEKINYK